MKKRVSIALILFAAFSAHATGKISSLECQSQSLKDAKKLLEFYSDNDDRIAIDESAKPLPQIKNPANKKQKFDVLEVWGNVYKGKYRMRLIYSSKDDCVLMGEEIMGYSDL